VAVEEDLGDVSSVDLPTIHRFTPQILELVKHIHLEYPTLDLGADWEFDSASLTSSAPSGPTPSIVRCGTSNAELVEAFRTVQRELKRTTAAGAGRVAVAVLDESLFPSYRKFAHDMAANSRTPVAVIESREDVEKVEKYIRRRVVVGPVEYLAGLQFDTLVVCGLPETNFGNANSGHRQRRFLSLLYLGISRAIREVVLIVNDESGGVPEVLEAACEKKILCLLRGPEV